MLEIVIVYFLCKRLGANLRAKGRRPLLLQILLVVFWLGEEFAGGLTAGIVHVIRFGDVPMDFDLSAYVFAIVGAACGAGLIFLIGHLLPDNTVKTAPQVETPGGAWPASLAPSDPSNPYSPPRF